MAFHLHVPSRLKRNKLSKFLHGSGKPREQPQNHHHPSRTSSWGSIFRKRHDHQHNADHKTEHTTVLLQESVDETVRLEESQSELSIISSSSMLNILRSPVVGSSSTAVELLGAAPPPPIELSPSSCQCLDEQDVPSWKETRANVATASSNASPRQRAVSFDTTTVRVYDLILGDNPHCKYPLGLGWTYRPSQTQVVTVEDYEDARSERVERRQKDRIFPRLYVPPEGTGVIVTGPSRKSSSSPPPPIPDVHYLPLHMEQDFDDDLARNSLAELDLQERRTRLRAYGYTESELRRLERQRRVHLALEYVAGMDDESERMSLKTVTSSLPCPKEESMDKEKADAVTHSVATKVPQSLPFPYSSKFISRYAY